ncbi:type II toxin-antitoxin system HicB family antitoxin [Leptospira perdikensis]|uniref:Type II toxin-antitoxin system HicB family antitoxin n=1 Tax=Leptospira perdikensis TaxID=2484948 RepID=A0A4R9JH10_9LEPT|nr:type II toxin-antitoxin system HicB family antitoxin [Leptospira perdikensis]TGL39027.1 type II toxin-antitoxin system HicB family antitoxin [Leptospira perdikensis]
MKYMVEIVKTNTGYSAHVPDLPGVFTVGDSLEEVGTFIQEAIQLHLHGLEEDGITAPPPKTNVIWVDV